MSLPEGVPGLSIIIPAYNEQARLPPRLGHVLDYLRLNYPSFELIVVDDGSSDDTVAVVEAVLAGEHRARLITYEPNRGKGYALRRGALASTGQYVVFTDADLSTPIEEVPRALACLCQADIVIGSRRLPASDIRRHQPLYRRLASDIFRWMRIGLVGLRQVADTQCGFKAYRGALARQLFARAQVDRFMIDVEVLYLAERAGLRIIEMSVRWNDAPGSKVRLWRGLVNTLRDLLRIRLRHGMQPAAALTDITH
jgi:dolichyl-phosphate beta-glucosyltransferase